eukprot:14027798-Heterocapsa_arctica.AAC.1
MAHELQALGGPPVISRNWPKTFFGGQKLVQTCAPVEAERMARRLKAAQTAENGEWLEAVRTF